MKAYKVEINPTDAQKVQINRTFGVCRFVYNLYIAENKKAHEEGRKFISGYTFHKWLNNEYRAENPDKKWITEVSSKAVKASIMNAERAYKNFFKNKKGFPKFKSRKDRNSFALYGVLRAERHRVLLPTLKWVKSKEYGYIPTDAQITSATVSEQAGKYFVSVLVADISEMSKGGGTSAGIGIDLGIKTFATVSDGRSFGNINKTSKARKLVKKLKKEQMSFARKPKRRNAAGPQKNRQKQLQKVRRAYYRVNCLRKDYVNKVVFSLVKTKPEYITVEDLNISGMMKNRHLSRAIQEMNFNRFTIVLEQKCKEQNIEMRYANRFYPSSKICSCCGCVKERLSLGERTYVCEHCGFTCDRDVNAAINLKNCTHYQAV